MGLESALQHALIASLRLCTAHMNTCSKSCRQKTKVRDRIQPWGRAKTNLGTFFDGPPDPKPFW